jgi:hypothetical protein
MAKPPQEPKLTRVDTYEEYFMAGGGRPIHREKMIKKYHWIYLIPMALCFVTSLWVFFRPDPDPATKIMGLLPLAMSAFFALQWIMFAILRVHVSDSEIHIQYGMFGPRINLHSLESCKVVEYQHSNYGGWGIRGMLDGNMAYIMMDQSNQMVELVWQEGGRTKKMCGIISQSSRTRTPNQFRSGSNCRSITD